MQIIAIRFPLIIQNDNVLDILVSQIKKNQSLKKGDIIVIASKILALADGNVKKIQEIQPSVNAKKIAKKHNIKSELAEIILTESGKIISKSQKAALTLKNNLIIANSGADYSNAPAGYIVLWPKNIYDWADKIKKKLDFEFKTKIGVIISDSHCSPLRLGTVGLAIAVSGFEPVEDKRETCDLFEKKLKITWHNLADSLASAANVIMGESNEKIPVTIIKKAPIKLSNKKSLALTKKLWIKPQDCLFHGYQL